MIPGLLHGRLLGGGPPPSGVVNPPDWSGATYSDSDYVVSGTATAQVVFTVKSDGTWVVNRGGVLTSGNWYVPGAGGIGAGYEVRFTVTGSTGVGSVTNGAAAFASLAADKAISLTASRSTLGSSNGSRTVLVEIRPTAGAVASSGPFIMEVEAETGG